MLSHTVMLWSVTEIEFEFFCFSTFKCSYFCFSYVLANTWMWDICIRATSAVCNSILSHWNLHIIRQQKQFGDRMAHMQTVASKGQYIQWSKESIWFIYNMSPKAGVWVPSVFWGSKFQFSFQAFHPYLELWRDESNEFRFC